MRILGIALFTSAIGSCVAVALDQTAFEVVKFVWSAVAIVVAIVAGLRMVVDD